jgi:hypothetical protein
MQTDVGVFMLAVKAIHLADLLRRSGEDVLLSIDGIRHVLQAEWHMVQLLSNVVSRVSGEMSFRAPRLPPISILNQIYSNCTNGGSKKEKGSFTAIVTTDNKTNDELMPEVTPYSNNLKHLNSLTKTVSFPVTFKHASTPRSRYQENQDDLPSLSYCVA